MGHWHWIVVERQPTRRAPRGILGPAVDDESTARQGAADARDRLLARAPSVTAVTRGPAENDVTAARHAVGVLGCSGECEETAGRWVQRWSASAR